VFGLQIVCYEINYIVAQMSSNPILIIRLFIIKVHLILFVSQHSSDNIATTKWISN